MLRGCLKSLGIESLRAQRSNDNLTLPILFSDDIETLRRGVSTGDLRSLLLPLLGNTLFFSARCPNNQGMNGFFRGDLVMRSGVGRNEARHPRGEFLHLAVTGLF